MPIFEFTWKAFGTLEIRAEDETDAQEYASEALFSLHAIEAEQINVDGVDLELA
jgi:hypothetical protein